METFIIAVLAVLALALAGALVASLRRTGERQGGVKEALETLFDPRVAEMRAEMDKVAGLVRELEKDRENKFGQLTNELKTVGEKTTALATTTQQLREALASGRVRGQWGERMADDVLRLIGFVEGVNYLKQRTMDGSGSRPDFTFLLPQDLKLNMDVKFPLDNYLKCIESETSEEEERFRRLSVRDVRARIKEVVTRDYIDPGQKTLDYVLVFIPNEQIYQFIHEQDSTLIDYALTSRVVLCSPVSLFAILVVIRQAMENFAVEQSSNQIISELGSFHKQWQGFMKQMERVGQRIGSVQTDFELLSGRRRRALERPLNRIESIREQRGLELPDDVVLEDSISDDLTFEESQISLEVTADGHSDAASGSS